MHAMQMTKNNGQRPSTLYLCMYKFIVLIEYQGWSI